MIKSEVCEDQKVACHASIMQFVQVFQYQLLPNITTIHWAILGIVNIILSDSNCCRIE